MAFKTTLFVCGLVLSIQNAYSQVVGWNGLGYNNGFGFNNAFAPSYGASAVGYGDVDITAIDIDSTGYGAAYGYGGLGNVGALGLGSAGLGLGNVGAVGFGSAGLGLGNVGAVGLGSAGLGLGNVGAVGFGSAGLGLGNAGALGIGAGLGNVGLGGLTVGNGLLAAGNAAYMDLGALSAGGYLPIATSGPIVPAGLTVVSDNVIEGVVAVEGQLPFLSAVAFEGALPSVGSGLTQCGCGSVGNIGIISESVGPAANWDGIALGNLSGLRLGNYGRGLIL